MDSIQPKLGPSKPCDLEDSLSSCDREVKDIAIRCRKEQFFIHNTRAIRYISIDK
jgi:hypothetical protein